MFHDHLFIYFIIKKPCAIWDNVQCYGWRDNRVGDPNVSFIKRAQSKQAGSNNSQQQCPWANKRVIQKTGKGHYVSYILACCD